jgi:hypothetical protein
MQRNWSLLELLNHATGQSTGGKGLKGSQHKALADHILHSNALAVERKAGRVGDCGGNQAIQAERDHTHTANQAKAAKRKRKVCKLSYFHKGLCYIIENMTPKTIFAFLFSKRILFTPTAAPTEEPADLHRRTEAPARRGMLQGRPY